MKTNKCSCGAPIYEEMTSCLDCAAKRLGKAMMSFGVTADEFLSGIEKIRDALTPA